MLKGLIQKTQFQCKRQQRKRNKTEGGDGAVHLRKSGGLRVTLPNTLEVLLVSVYWDEISRQELVTYGCPL